MVCLPTMTLRPCDCDLRRRWRLRRRQSMHSRYCAAFVARRSTAALHRGVLGPSSPSSSSIPGSYPFHSFDFVRLRSMTDQDSDRALSPRPHHLSSHISLLLLLPVVPVVPILVLVVPRTRRHVPAIVKVLNARPNLPPPIQD